MMMDEEFDPEDIDLYPEEIEDEDLVKVKPAAKDVDDLEEDSDEEDDDWFDDDVLDDFDGSLIFDEEIE